MYVDWDIKPYSTNQPNPSKSAKFREHSSLWQFKFIEDHLSWCQSYVRTYMQLPVSH